MTTDIFSEGIQIPIVKYQKAGVVNQDLVDIIAMNVRLPERAMGDLRAQITAVTTGERRFLELRATLRRAMRCRHRSPSSDQSEAVARANTRRFPMASTRPSRSWTTTAWRSASASRSASR